MAKVLDIEKARSLGYSDDEISNFLEKNPELKPKKESTLHKIARVGAEQLPLAGGVAVPTIAAISSGGISLPATAGLAGVGAAGGEAAKQLALRALGEKTPATSTEAAEDIGLEGAKTAALTYGGGKIGGKMLSALKTLSSPSVEAAKAAQGAFEASKGILMEELPTKLPKTTNQINDFANSMKQIAGKGVNELAKNIEPEGLQGLRKQIQVLLNSGAKVGPEAEKFLVNAKQTFEQALEKSVPGYATVRATTASAYQKEALLDALTKVAKKGAKLAGAGAAGALGFTGIRRLIGGQ